MRDVEFHPPSQRSEGDRMQNCIVVMKGFLEDSPVSTSVFWANLTKVESILPFKN